MSEITIFIPSYNPGKLLIDALKSIYNQTYSDWRVILVDDASTDDSLMLAENLLNDPRITVVKNEINVGQSKAQNIALELVTTPYMVQLDSDDWFVPYTLETLVNEFKKQPGDVAVVSGNIMVVNEETEYMKEHDNIPISFVRRGRIFKDRYDFLLSNMSLWPRCYRTSALREIGGWPVDDPYEGRNMEDKLVLFRLIEKFRFHWVDEVLYVHRRHDYNNTRKIDEYNNIIEYNAKQVLKRWGDNFEPVFDIDSYGWKNVVHLAKKNKIELKNENINSIDKNHSTELNKKKLDKAFYYII